MNAVHGVFLDTNVFGYLVRMKGGGYKDFLYWVLDKSGNVKAGDDLYLFSTPFAVLEYIGVPKIGQPTRFDVASSGLQKASAGDMTNAVYEHALKFYRTDPTVSFHALDQRNRENRAGLPWSGFELYDTLATEHVQNDKMDLFHSHLAFDWVAKFRFPKNLQMASHIQFASLLADSLDHGLNRSAVRKIAEMALDLSRSDKFKGTTDERLEFRKMFQLKTHKDYVDTELAQYAVLGKHVDGPGRIPVHCLTCDNIREIKIRALFVKSVVQFILGEIEELRKKGVEVRFSGGKPAFGFIHCFELGTLKHLETINVETLESPD